MPEIASRSRTQPPPPRIVYEALTKPDRDPTRPWLILHNDEQRPSIPEAADPNLVVWTSIWLWRPDARIRFGIIGPPHGSTTLSWTLIVDELVPDGETIVRMRNESTNSSTRTCASRSVNSHPIKDPSSTPVERSPFRHRTP
ncbi:hypothetical protein L1080_033545 [Rhodococcus sp. MSC1_016]|uniref:hypothetical protein n=1 Tax=Rhodococcus sp. MSC1_016 TaxID=2909266 RepID=UPI00202EBC6D|nr:hypothetical protein [Rhodococcus sp. MSC1_016]